MLRRRLGFDVTVSSPVSERRARAEGTVFEPPLPLPRELARADQRPFVGRAAPLQRLRERWLESSRGFGGLVAARR